MKELAVIGIGNILLRDDGIGVHIVNKLQEEKIEYNIDLIDGGTSTLDLLDPFVKNKKVIIVDSLKGGHTPGTIYKITPEELGEYIKAKSSLHDVQILDIVKQANLLGYFPEVTIIGIEPEEIFYDLDLSETLKSEVPKLIQIVKEEIAEKIGDINA